jgi:hypothetical protein
MENEYRKENEKDKIKRYCVRRNGFYLIGNTVVCYKDKGYSYRKNSKRTLRIGSSYIAAGLGAKKFASELFAPTSYPSTIFPIVDCSILFLLEYNKLGVICAAMCLRRNLYEWRRVSIYEYESSKLRKKLFIN